MAQGANIAIKDNEGKTALIIAKENKSIEVTELIENYNIN